MITIVENIWEEIKIHEILKNDHVSKVKDQTALISFT